MASLIAVDDEPALLALLAEALPLAGHRLRTAADAAGLAAELAGELPDLVILDIGLPGESGLAIARRLRATHDLGIILLTGADATQDRVAGLDSGADDYVTKPFSMAELDARIRAVLRRRLLSGRGMLPFGPLSVDLRGWRVLDTTGAALPLFPTEIDLIAALASHPGRVLTRDDLLRLAPAQGDEPLDRSIDNRIARLRGKLRALGLDPALIQVSRGAGYLFRRAIW